MSLENNISKNNKIPGCDQLTRPEEIQALSKYLGTIRDSKDKEAERKVEGLDKLFVPGYNTGRFPEVTLGDRIESLEDTRDVELDSTLLKVPEKRDEVENLHNLHLPIKLDVKENIELDKTLISITSDDISDLDNTRIDIHDSRKVELESKVIKGLEEGKVDLGDKVIKGIQESNIELENKKIANDVDESEISTLDDRIVSLGVDDKSKLGDKRIGLNVESGLSLGNQKIKIYPEENLKLGDKVLKTYDDSKIKLGDKVVKGLDDRDIEISDKLVNLSQNKGDDAEELDNRVVALKSVEDVEDLSDKVVKNPGCENIYHQSYSKHGGNALEDTIKSLNLEGEAKKYFEEFAEKYISSDKSVTQVEIFNLVMSLFESIKSFDKYKEEYWEKLQSDFNKYWLESIQNIPGWRAERSNKENLLLERFLYGMPIDKSEGDSILQHFWENERENHLGNTSLPFSQSINLATDPRFSSDEEEASEDGIVLSSKYVVVPPAASNKSGFDPYSSYLDAAVEAAKTTAGKWGSALQKLGNTFFGDNKDKKTGKTKNSLVDKIAELGILTLNKLEGNENYSTTSNSSANRKQLRWSLPGAEKNPFENKNNSLAERVLYGKDVMGNIMTFGNDLISSGLSNYVFEEQSLDPNSPDDLKKIKDSGNNLIDTYNSLSEISDPVRNGYYLVDGKIYKYRLDAKGDETSGMKSVLKKYGNSFKEYANGVSGEFKKDPVKTVKNLTNKLINSGGKVKTADYSKVYNRPKRGEKRTDFEFATKNDKSLLKTAAEGINSNLNAYSSTGYLEYKDGDGSGLNLKLNPTSSNFKDRYLSSYGIQTTLAELCKTSVPSSVEDLMDILKNSENITTVSKFGTTGLGNRFAQTLDSNACWEVIIEPFVHKEMNGGYSYLPAIQEINTLNLAEHGVNTGYNRWIPISSFNLQKSKMISKQIPLFDGEFSVPLAAELTNDLTLTVFDDQYKSWRNYFQKCMDVSVYSSQIHDENYYKTGYNSSTAQEVTGDTFNLSNRDGDKVKSLKTSAISSIQSQIESNLTDYNGRWIPTAVDKSVECTALYKNITFRIKIYIMTQQYSTIKKFDLLCVLREFSEEFNGDTDSSPADLNLQFSIVGEDPDHYHDPTEFDQKAFKWWQQQDEYVEAKKLALRILDQDSAEERRLHMEALKETEEKKQKAGEQERARIAAEKAAAKAAEEAKLNKEVTVFFLTKEGTEGNYQKNTKAVALEEYHGSVEEMLAANPGWYIDRNMLSSEAVFTGVGYENEVSYDENGIPYYKKVVGVGGILGTFAEVPYEGTINSDGSFSGGTLRAMNEWNKEYKKLLDSKTKLQNSDTAWMNDDSYELMSNEDIVLEYVKGDLSRDEIVDNAINEVNEVAKEREKKRKEAEEAATKEFFEKSQGVGSYDNLTDSEKLRVQKLVNEVNAKQAEYDSSVSNYDKLVLEEFNKSGYSYVVTGDGTYLEGQDALTAAQKTPYSMVPGNNNTFTNRKEVWQKTKDNAAKAEETVKNKLSNQKNAISVVKIQAVSEFDNITGKKV